MNETEAAPTALERAERILSRRSPVATPVETSRVKQVEAQADRPSQSLGQTVMRAAARGYVALALKTQRVADSVSHSWTQSVDQARREQEQQVARTQGAAAARQEAAEEQRGEKTLRSAFGDAEKAADTAGEVAEA